jgi:hypothetical protein
MNAGPLAHQTSSVPLVLKPTMGAITPQLLIFFDDCFPTVSSSSDELPDFNSPKWAQLFGASVYQYPFNEDDLEDTKNVLDDVEVLKH